MADYTDHNHCRDASGAYASSLKRSKGSAITLPSPSSVLRGKKTPALTGRPMGSMQYII